MSDHQLSNGGVTVLEGRNRSQSVRTRWGSEGRPCCMKEMSKS